MPPFLYWQRENFRYDGTGREVSKEVSQERGDEEKEEATLIINARAYRN